ncbi:hypothetical protein ASG22_04695 [Chryseobacterium sp. Leaf405]|uniref:hypothetical protein n=1 Tax=Chryseobacterium sp. Leaf405 TaxID=1736367 RepID=UPI0006F389E0|nr:hypothetical protein [Chryseobacterium sp. Leaf405]KQT25996.1 hypothetical protein ASG22_04695 [Chryseobacterium sp. Leaf405]
MNKIILKPLEGILVNDKKIEFGQGKNDIINLLGKPDNDEEEQFYYDSLDVRFDFDDNGGLEFVECQGPYSENTEFSIYDINPFKLYDTDLIDFLTNKNNGEIDDFEAPYSYSFLEISVGIWRASIPVDIESTITEMKEEGTYEESKEIMDQDLEKSKYFWTIAVGKTDYYK